MKTTANSTSLSKSERQRLVFKRAWYFLKAKKFNTFSECLKYSYEVQKTLKADNLTYTVVYNKYHSIIKNHIVIKIKNTEMAENLTQDTFIKVFNHFHEYDNCISKVSTWVYKIANNVIIDYVRKAQKTKILSVSDYVDETGKEYYPIAETSRADDDLKNDETMSKINKAFATLKPKYRQIAELYFIEQKQYLEIAEICNVPMGTVKGMVNRCREKLQAELKSIYVH